MGEEESAITGEILLVDVEIVDIKIDENAMQYYKALLQVPIVNLL